MSSFRQGMLYALNNTCNLGYTSGHNERGQLGVPGMPNDGTGELYKVHQLGFIKWNYIHAGDKFTIAIDTEGYLWGWGDNSKSQLGLCDDTSDVVYKPTRIHCNTYTIDDTTYKAYPDIKFKSVHSHEGSVHAIDEDGRLWGWGHNPENRLLILNGEEHEYINKPTPVNTNIRWHMVAMSGNNTVGVVSRRIMDNTGGNSYIYIHNEVYGWHKGQSKISKICSDDNADVDILSISVSDSSVILLKGQLVYKHAVKTQDNTIATSFVIAYSMPTSVSTSDSKSIRNINPLYVKNAKVNDIDIQCIGCSGSIYRRGAYPEPKCSIIFILMDDLLCRSLSDCDNIYEYDKEESPDVLSVSSYIGYSGHVCTILTKSSENIVRYSSLSINTEDVSDPGQEPYRTITHDENPTTDLIPTSALDAGNECTGRLIVSVGVDHICMANIKI